jgi:hypothetical protein
MSSSRNGGSGWALRDCRDLAGAIGGCQRTGAIGGRIMRPILPPWRRRESLAVHRQQQHHAARRHCVHERFGDVGYRRTRTSVRFRALAHESGRLLICCRVRRVETPPLGCRLSSHPNRPSRTGHPLRLAEEQPNRSPSRLAEEQRTGDIVGPQTVSALPVRQLHDIHTCGRPVVGR